MKKMLLVGLMMFVSVAALAGRTKMDEMPVPNLMAPGDDLVIGGKPEVEFRWSGEGDRTKLQYYDFRLYAGPRGYEPDLILKEQVPPGQTSFLVKSSVFQVGQTYSWSIRQFGGASKSRRAYSVFKVVG